MLRKNSFNHININVNYEFGLGIQNIIDLEHIKLESILKECKIFQYYEHFKDIVSGTTLEEEGHL